MSRVLLITSVFPPQIGGPACFMDRLAHVLVSRGYVLTVVCATPADPSTSGDHERPFRVVRLDREGRIPFRLRLWYILGLQVLTHPWILVNNLEYPVWRVARLLGRRYVLRLVGDSVWERGRNAGVVTETIDDFQNQSPPEGLAGMAAQRVSYLRDARLVITPSDYVCALAQGWGAVPAKTMVIHNGIPKSRLSTAPPYRSPAQPLKVAYVGRFVNWKGIETLILASVPLADKVQVTLVGDGPELPAMRELARQSGADDHIRFVGRLTEAGVFRTLRESHVLVLTSAYEGLSHALLEGMACGLACIASDCGGNPELIDDQSDGLLVPYGDVVALRESLEQLAGNEKLRMALGRRAISKAEKFDFDRTVDRYADALTATPGCR